MRNAKIYAVALAIAAASCSMFTSLTSAQSLEPSTESQQLSPTLIPDEVEHEALIATPDATSGSCGVERWSVKTGTDPDAGLVNLNNPVIQTISYLRAQPAPATPPANSRVQPTETTMFVIDATLTEYKLENDSDYHLVVQDASGNTMITEIPDPACVGTGSPFASYITTARQQFDAKYTTTTSFQTANIPVQITGVGFFDFQHGQTGVAPNAIELHPVLDIRFNPSSGNPDFALSAAPASVSVTQGSSGTSTLTVSPSGGFTGSVNLSASGLPSGVTAAFSPASTTGTSTLTLTAAATATTGAAIVTVTGVSGSLSHTTTLNLTVVAAGGGGGQTAVYNAALKAPGCATTGSSCDSGPTLLLGRGTMSGGVEPNQPNTINNSCADGTSGTFHSDESNDRIAIASTDGGPLTAGKTAKITATVWAYDSTSDALDLYSAANANNPTWVFLNTIKPAAAGAQTLATTFTLPSGGLQAVRAHFRYQGTASSCSTGAYDDADDLVFAVAAGTPTPDFSVAASPTSLAVNQGASGTSTLTIGSLNGFSAATTFSVSGLPSGVTVSFSANPVTPASGGSATSTLTLAASSTATVGAATVTVTATSGSISHTATVGLTVNAVTQPDYSLSASPASVSATQGGSTSSTISIAPVGGFSGSVNLSASGLPGGVTASFNPASTAGTSVLTLTASATATTGTATVTVTGTSGSLSHTTTVSLTVNATTPPDYSLSASPSSVSVTQGASASSTINLARVGGFSGSVSLAASGLPSGVTATFSPASTTGGTSTLTLTASSTATTGTATVTVTGTSGTLSHTAMISLTVSASGGTPQQLFGNPGFESGVATPWSISSGALCSNGTCTGETAHAGTWFAWLDGYGSAHTDTLSQQVTLPAAKTTATLAFWLHIDTAETSMTTVYDKLTVQVLNSSGTVLKTLATYSNLNANTSYAQRTFDVSAYIGQTVTIRFTGTEDSQLQTSFVLDDLTLTVQ